MQTISASLRAWADEHEEAFTQLAEILLVPPVQEISKTVFSKDIKRTPTLKKVFGPGGKMNVKVTVSGSASEGPSGKVGVSLHF